MLGDELETALRCFASKAEGRALGESESAAPQPQNRPPAVPLDAFFNDSTDYYWVIWGGKHHPKFKLAIPGSVSAAKDFVHARENHRTVAVRRCATAWEGEEDIIELARLIHERNKAAKCHESKTARRAVPVVAFSGHGTDTGDWCLSDNNCQQEFLLAPHFENYELGRPLIIVADCCHAGNWCISKAISRYGKGVTLIASCGPGELTEERSASPSEPGNFWQMMLGRPAARECAFCKSLRTKRVKTHKVYTGNHKCEHVRMPMAFVSGNLLRWDQDGFVEYGTHRCTGGALPRTGTPVFFGGEMQGFFPEESKDKELDEEEEHEEDEVSED
eukprot:gnl/TRDRNA2_/TRDRNA2_86330_c0_seq1.p1 gnl/TRDRNA2_/TRDRNA2_86330_c0~~gnl/TRDRNA2_/TRDRNA2_86330_c0_seq1.p1  ORF type:complete len:352 (+),score=59.65 gnl/TRDRNA2_/TRDRNA2_86330_c0_seq1:62-1057(+)